MDAQNTTLISPHRKAHRPTTKKNVVWRCQGGVWRLLRLCVLGVALPGLLVAVPLYLKYRVYSQHLVPLAMSDMRMIDNKISTTWCQRQLVTSNTTFNAYLLANRPSISKSDQFVNLKREMVLEDDMKEYWGFYLLKGSTVTVSACARRAGASLIIIRGHHHLRQCAYIGDDSSEEEEELVEMRQHKGAALMPSEPGEQQEKKYSNRKRLEKVRPDVMFGTNRSIGEDALISKQLDMGDKADDFDMALLEQHRAQIRTNNKARYSPQPPPPSLPSKEIFNALVHKLKSYKTQGKHAVDELKKHLTTGQDDQDHDPLQWLHRLIESSENSQATDDNIDRSPDDRQRRHAVVRSIWEQLNLDDGGADNAEEQGVEHAEVRGRINGTTVNDTSNSEFWSSFSSSEERLLECAGLIVSEPLSPSALCRPSYPLHQKQQAAHHHTITYTVPVNGYYFFVFSSENEIEENYVWTEFVLEKMQYDIRDAVAACHNSTGQCSLPLHFFSEERLVLELPMNESLWNSEFLVVSTCEPRTALYIACIVAVPILILLFAL